MARAKAGQGGIQTVLPGLDWKTCQCGCGLQFLPLKKGRQRRYFNDTHKTRAYRNRKWERAQNDAISFQMWEGCTDSLVEEYACSDANENAQQWAQYELQRRARFADFD
jgi:hypothetical protein